MYNDCNYNGRVWGRGGTHVMSPRKGLKFGEGEGAQILNGFVLQLIKHY